MLKYIRSIEDMVNLGHNANNPVIKITNGRNHQLWRKCFMNGDEVGFFVLTRKVYG